MSQHAGMNTKHCRTCSTTKPVTSFHLRAASVDGLASKCIDCQKKYDSERLHAPHRVKARKAYQQTENFRISHNAASKRWYERHPKKRAAHIALGNALRDGRIHRQPCEVCKNPKAEAHHDDYNKPLDVRWLCDEHHKQHHMSQ